VCFPAALLVLQRWLYAPFSSVIARFVRRISSGRFFFVILAPRSVLRFGTSLLLIFFLGIALFFGTRFYVGLLFCYSGVMLSSAFWYSLLVLLCFQCASCVRFFFAVLAPIANS
jgi:hypothetical protein